MLEVVEHQTARQDCLKTRPGQPVAFPRVMYTVLPTLVPARGGAPGPCPRSAVAGAVTLDTAVVQQIMLFLLVALVAISLWQWRHRPAKVNVPKGFRIAIVRNRALAAAIDLVISLVVVFTVFGLFSNGEWVDLLKAWAAGFFAPADLYAEHPVLLWVLGGYLAHVTVGEMFTGRSIGKAIVGTRVVATDGMPANPGAIFLRNLVKLFEVTTGVLLIYIILSEHRQRLGDLLARTMVISAGEEKKEPAENEKKSGDE